MECLDPGKVYKINSVESERDFCIGGLPLILIRHDVTYNRYTFEDLEQVWKYIFNCPEENLTVGTEMQLLWMQTG